MIVWTKKAERHWRATRQKYRWKERVAGQRAYFDGVPVAYSENLNSVFVSFAEKGWVRDDGKKDKETKVAIKECPNLHRWLVVKKLRDKNVPFQTIAEVLEINYSSLRAWIRNNRKRFKNVFGDVKEVKA